MSHTVKFIAHPQSVQLRLQAADHQTSFTLSPKVASIPEKSLSKIESWCLEYLDGYTTYRIVQELRQTNVQVELQRLREMAPVQSPAAPQTNIPSFAVCDYSTQGKLAVWGCVISHAGQTIRCCGQVPVGQKGEPYAIKRTHQYLKQLGIKAIIFSDEEGSVRKLQAQLPVQHMNRRHPQHRPAHQLAHHFALLLAGRQETGDPLKALRPLLGQVWDKTPRAEYICLKGKWRVSLLE